jgi:L-iditol 2-dehydrogenase
MLAVIYDPVNGFGLRKTEVPKPKKGELVVRMKACGLCGTDLEKIQGSYTASMPVVGHEPAGIIEQLGEGVNGFSEGERVFAHHHVPCGECWLCVSGSETMCSAYRKSNIFPGGFSEYFLVPQWNVSRGGVLKLPDSVTFEEGALIEPTACCIRGLRKAGGNSARTAFVVGSGPVGLTHVKLLSMNGTKVFVSDVNKRRLSLAEEFGAERTIDASESDASKEVSEYTGGEGVDLAVVATGNPSAVTQALRSLRKGGRLCLFGVPVKGSKLEYGLADLFNSELSIITSYGASETDTKEALNLISSGRLDLKKIISHEFPLKEFEMAVKASMDGQTVKVIMQG